MSAERPLRELGELAVLSSLRRILEDAGPRVPGFIGIGDDAAVVPSAPGRSTVVTVDALVEGVHFDRRWAAARLVGRKAAAVNLSDVAAMGGIPRYALLALIAPSELSLEWLEEFARGFGERLREFGAHVVGGNLSSGDRFSATVTLLGDVEAGRAVTRGGGCPGDRLFVSGPLGGAALGLALLRGELPGAPAPEPLGAALRAAQLDPTPRVHEGQLAASYARAMIDLSDGLLPDLRRLCAECGCGAELELARLPRLEGADALARALGREDVFLEGGEEYELLLAVPESATAAFLATAAGQGSRFYDIGALRAEPGVVVVDEAGGRKEVAIRGFEHFR